MPPHEFSQFLLNRQDLLALSLTSMLLSIGLAGSVWSVWRIAQGWDWLRKTFSLLNFAEQTIVRFIGRIIGLQQKRGLSRWLSLAAFASVSYVGGAFLPAAWGLGTAAFGFVGVYTVFRQWAHDEARREKKLLPLGVVEGWDSDLRQEVLASIAFLFFLTPVVFVRIAEASSDNFSPAAHALTNFGMTMFVWEHFAKAIVFVDYAEIFETYSISYVSPASLSAKLATFAWRIVLDLLLLTGIVKLITISRDQATGKDLRDLHDKLRSANVSDAEMALDLAERLALTGNTESREVLELVSINYHEDERVRLADSLNQHDRTSLRLKATFSLIKVGRQMGVPGPYYAAVAASRQTIDFLSDKTGPDWNVLSGSAFNYLGAALLCLDSIEKSKSSVVQAHEAFGEALLRRTRDLDPEGWAATQHNIGNTYQAMATREDELVNHTRAAAAYRLALDVRTKDRNKEDWALTLRNLGNSLLSAGILRSDIELISKAREALESSLEGFDKANHPDDWAQTMVDIGCTLGQLGKQQNNAAVIEEAVTHFRESLGVLDRQSSPVLWSSIQDYLGTALYNIADQENDNNKLSEAISAFENSLGERKRERIPLDWANTQSKLANCYRILGIHTGEEEHLKNAAIRFRLAIEECTRDRAPLMWAGLHNALGATLETIGEGDNRIAYLHEAIATYRNALRTFTKDKIPHEWAAVQNNIGNAEYALARKTGDDRYLEAAIASYENAIEIWGVDREPFHFILAQYNLGAVLDTLGQKQNSYAHSLNAAKSYAEVLYVLCRGDGAQDPGDTPSNLERVLERLIADATTQGQLLEAISILRPIGQDALKLENRQLFQLASQALLRLFQIARDQYKNESFDEEARKLKSLRG